MAKTPRVPSRARWAYLAAGLLAALAFPAAGYSHDSDAPRRLPENVFEDNLTDAEGAQLADAVAKVRKSVFYVGHPKGVHGTAFLVSRERRLLVTAAHVADNFEKLGSLIAVPDGSTAWYRVQRVYYHPGVMRRLDQGLHVRTDRVKDGEISHRGPDIALLELAPGGPELPEACVMATDEELRAMDHPPVVEVGYPGDHDAWPPGVRPVSVSSAIGHLCGMDAYHRHGNGGAPFEARRRVRIDCNELGSGSSGGPFCLANGHVIAVMSHRLWPLRSNSSEAATRIDAVRELLDRPTFPRLRTALFDFTLTGNNARPSPADADGAKTAEELERLRKAVEELKQAADLKSADKFSQSVAICNRVIKQFPRYAKAYSLRGDAYQMYGLSFGPGSPQFRQYLEWARDDYGRSSGLDPDLVLDKRDAFWCRMVLSWRKEEAAVLRSLIAETTAELATLDELDWITARFVSFRATCRSGLGDLPGALLDLDEAIRLCPDWSSYWDERADILDRLNRPTDAAESRRIAEELNAPDPDEKP